MKARDLREGIQGMEVIVRDGKGGSYAMEGSDPRERKEKRWKGRKGRHRKGRKRGTLKGSGIEKWGERGNQNQHMKRR